MLELGVELGGEGLVVGQDQRRPLEAGDDVGHREGLAGAGDAEKGLMAVPDADRIDQSLDGLGLVAPGLVLGLELEQHRRAVTQAGSRWEASG